MRLSPNWLVAGVTFLALSGFALAGAYVMNQPWLGLELEPRETASGLRVVSVSPGHPNAQLIVPGDVLVSAGGAHGHAQELVGNLLLPEPDVLDFSALRAFFKANSALANGWIEGRLQVVLLNGSVHGLSSAQRSMAQVPIELMLHALYAIVTILVAFGVWAYRPQMLAPRLLALSAIGFYLMNLGPAIYGARELALDGVVFARLSSLNHLGATLHIFSMAALLWVYPVRPRRPAMHWWVLAAAAMACIADLLQLGVSAVLNHYVPLAAAFTLGLAFAVMQWSLSKGRPLERAALRWIVLACFWATSTSTLLIVVPAIFGQDHLIAQHFAFAPVPLMFLGLTAGIARYRLFDLDAWWMRTWLWLVTGIAMVLVDALLVMLLQWNAASSLALSVLVAGFVYLPLRQWAWTHLHGERSIVDVLPKVTAAIAATPSVTELDRHWLAVIRSIYQPLTAEVNSDLDKQVVLSEDATSLRIPRLEGPGVMTMTFPQHGARLFNRADLRMAQVLYSLGSQGAVSVKTREQVAARERVRVMDELHDDLGAKLLSIVHGPGMKDDRDLARHALQDLRSLASALPATPPVVLTELLTDWRDEFTRRIERSPRLEAHWSQPAELADVMLPGADAADLTSLLREAVSNILKHAAASEIRLGIELIGRQLSICLSNDGHMVDVEAWTPGRGLKTMRKRAARVAADLEYSAPAQGGLVMTIGYLIPAREPALSLQS